MIKQRRLEAHEEEIQKDGHEDGSRKKIRSKTLNRKIESTPRRGKSYLLAHIAPIFHN